MKWSLDIFLKNYDPENTELFLKARFVILVTVAVILATVVTVTHSIWFMEFGAGILVQIVAALVMVGALGILVKGYYTCAIHTIFIGGFTSLWLVLFLDPPSPAVAKLNSIVLVIGLFSAMNIAFF